ncbi:HAMP domain-containing protein [Sphaerotilus uruguayifluvii]|uniref:HAMP domain-containing protein n=1 Tax=Sphaerotilus uruguayifluvii TaxID=2735897 RepID=A0ABX2G8D9_9BURK|nr:HAMP domain-containing protein [Leptothrix sp. C29]NRT58285.1 HAMP domain-containing protein [Leptothrix sp. C29]
MTSRSRHRSSPTIRTRLLLCALLPLGLATAAVLVAQGHFGNSDTPLAGALLLGALGCAMALVHLHAREISRPLRQAEKALEALQRGDYDHRVPVTRLDESGRVLLRIRELGDYLAVVLPTEEDDGPDERPSPAPRQARGGGAPAARAGRAAQAREAVSSLPASAGQSRM